MASTTPELSTLKDINALIARESEVLRGRELQILEAGCGRKWPIDLSGVRYRLTGVDLDAKALEAVKTTSGPARSHRRRLAFDRLSTRAVRCRL